MIKKQDDACVCGVCRGVSVVSVSVYLLVCVMKKKERKEVEVRKTHLGAHLHFRHHNIHQGMVELGTAEFTCRVRVQGSEFEKSSKKGSTIKVSIL